MIGSYRIKRPNVGVMCPRPLLASVRERSRVPSLIATSAGKSNKRPYMNDFKSWMDYLDKKNLLQTFISILMPPCVDTVQEIGEWMKDLGDEDFKNMSEEEISFEHQFAVKWPQTRRNIVRNAIKIFSIDFLRKSYEHLIKAMSSSKKLVDRFTKDIEKSALRKLDRYGRDYLHDRPYVAMLMVRTAAWSLALQRFSFFSYEMLKAQYTYVRRTGEYIMSVYIYIYIYIMSMSVHVYIYIYVCV